MALRLRRRPGWVGASTQGSPTSTRPRSLADVLDDDVATRRAAIRDRIETLLSVLGRPVASSDPAALLGALEEALSDPGPDQAWLALAVLTSRLPDPAAVQQTVRAARLDGPGPALWRALVGSGQLDAGPWSSVEVVTGRVLVDLDHTAQNHFATGIQRVARETARRWNRDHEIIIVGWTAGYASFRRLSAAEIDVALTGGPDRAATAPSAPNAILVPWHCVHLVAELPVEHDRTAHYKAYMQYSGSTTGLIGFDCVPVMAAETTGEGMPVGFANYLAAAAHVDRIATISDASRLEYAGWRTMLAGTGQSGPDIHCVPLPVQANPPTDTAMRETRELLGIGPLPVVLAVGSHEPRKNHLALLHAAEILWREGLLFNLVFVGGNSWNSSNFDAQVEALRRANRPLQTIRGLPDDLLWAAYRQAYCTVFPSLHEGFGLPVAESLASGTPVITSNFGSMRELASRGGALLIDPRNDQELTAALRQLLLDQPLRDRLAAEAAQLTLRTWDQYAADTWAYLVDGTTPPPNPTPP